MNWPSAAEQSVYAALLDAWRASAPALAEATGLSPTTTRRALAALAARGLARHEGRDWLPLSPDPALEPALLAEEESLIERQRAIGERRRDAAALHEAYLRAAARRGPEEIVRILRGPEEIEGAYAGNIRATRDEVLVMTRPPMLYLPVHVDELELSVMRSGVRWRTLYQADFLELPGAREFLAAGAAAGEVARVLPALPMKLMVHDRRAALVPLDADEPGLKNALQVSSSMLLRALVVLFESLWAQALPLHGDDPARPDGAAPEDPLWPLLAAGLKDEAIARQLGWGLRTVRRRVAAAMTALDARTRFQAGVEASRRGWPRVQ